jgi:hypothetical protein
MLPCFTPYLFFRSSRLSTARVGGYFLALPLPLLLFVVGALALGVLFLLVILDPM